MPSPAYDIATTLPYGDSTLALSIEGKRDGNVSRRRFIALGRTLGLPERAMGRLLDRIVTDVDEWIDGVDALPFDRGQLVKLKKTISRRQRLLAET